MIDCSLPLSAKIFDHFQILILWFWGKELTASLSYVRKIIKDPSLEKVCYWPEKVEIGCIISIIQNSLTYPLVQVRSKEHPRNFTKRIASPLFRSFCALPPIMQVIRDLTTDLICLDYVDRSILVTFVGRNAWDLQEVLCKFSHVLLLVSLSNRGHFTASFACVP